MRTILSPGKGLHRAEEYSQYFKTLGREGVIDAGLAESLADMAKFRNLIVHRYAEIELEKVYNLLSKNLDDFREYAKQVLAYCNK